MTIFAPTFFSKPDITGKASKQILRRTLARFVARLMSFSSARHDTSIIDTISQTSYLFKNYNTIEFLVMPRINLTNTFVYKKICLN
ncbi:MAG: hypothetical protein B6242_08050 [Anaerolineaceae bacterium 4572_78]|nr:MAG: hypothetical protein B6242_08050 [Anaerolineaceae bacterium 4572_78]